MLEAAVSDNAQPPMGRRERKKLALRASMVSHCRDLIEEKGVEGTTVDALCERVDISKKTFYNYFDSKNALVLEICQSHLLAGIQDMVDVAADEELSCAAQVELIFRTLFESREIMGRFDLELIDYMVSNFGRNRGASVGLLDDMIGLFTEFFRRHVDALKPQYSPEFCGEMTVGMLNAVLMNWMNHRESLHMDKVLELSAFIRDSMLKP